MFHIITDKRYNIYAVYHHLDKGRNKKETKKNKKISRNVIKRRSDVKKKRVCRTLTIKLY